MSDTREALRRGIGDYTPRPDAYGRVLERRDRKARNRGLGAFAVVALIALAGAMAVAQELRSASVPLDDVPPPTQDVHDWPGALRNPPGVYSWDGPGGNWLQSWMHNGNGSGDVSIHLHVLPEGTVSALPERAVSDVGSMAVTVAGHEGIYRRIDPGHGDQQEEWIVDIDGATISILLTAARRTSESDLAEAHAIIQSMRTEPQDNDLGFRLVFTLATNDWDSG